MKKYFDVTETVRYSHRIEIEINDEDEDDYEEFADEIAFDIENRTFYSTHEIIMQFKVVYGDAVEFIEDGSPDVRYEAY